MSTIAREDRKFAGQLHRLDHINQFLCEIATAILPGNEAFENVWSAANRVCDQYYSPKVRVMGRSNYARTRTALSA